MAPTRAALLVGINYVGSDVALRGCENDVLHMKAFLERHGYADIKVLTRDATRTNVLRALLELVISGAQDMFFHYSGHGSRVADARGDRRDGMDDCIVPVDYQQNGMILDDHLRGIVSLVPPGANLMVVLDSCHSGTCMDLCFNYKGSGTMARDPYFARTDGNVFMLSGSADLQTSADAVEDGQNQGAMTWSLMKTLNSGAFHTWADLVTNVRTTLADEHYTQVPNFSSGKECDLSQPPFFLL